MPKAAVYENDGVSRRKNKIWLTRKPASAKPVAEAKGMQGFAYKKLWRGVFIFNTRHHPASRSRIDNVRHTFV